MGELGSGKWAWLPLGMLSTSLLTAWPRPGTHLTQVAAWRRGSLGSGLCSHCLFLSGLVLPLVHARNQDPGGVRAVLFLPSEL